MPELNELAVHNFGQQVRNEVYAATHSTAPMVISFACFEFVTGTAESGITRADCTGD